MFLRSVLGPALLIAALSISSLPARAGPQFAIALQGYDAVSFFDSGPPAKGDFDHAFYWNGVTWLFASEANARRFEQDPRRYAPQFDGYCALAASLGYKAPGDALTGRIVDGKLYLNYNADIQKKWSGDVRGYISKADKNWPEVSATTKVIE
jgi:hypothetical protein